MRKLFISFFILLLLLIAFPNCIKSETLNGYKYVDGYTTGEKKKGYDGLLHNTFNAGSMNERPAMPMLDGELVYCIEPEVLSELHDNYSAVAPNTVYSNYDIKMLELIAYFGYGYKNDYSDMSLLATQCALWEYFGSICTDITLELRSKINDILSKALSCLNQVVPSFANSEIKLSGFGKDYQINVVDNNNVVNDFNVNLDSNLLNYENNDNEITISANNYFDSTSINYTYLSQNDFRGLGRSILYLSNSGKQKMMRIGDPNSIGANLAVSLILPFGELEINKKDEWNENAGSLIKYALWHAQYDEINDVYTIDRPYLAYEDYGKGIEQSIFETDENGMINIKLQCGSNLPDLYDVSGYYVLKEVETTNPYILDEKEYLIKINENEKTIFNHQNINRSISINLTKIDEEDNYRKINESCFAVYDISNTLDLFKEEIINGKQNEIINYPIEELRIIKNNKTYYLAKLLELDNHQYLDAPIKYKVDNKSLVNLNSDGYLKTLKNGTINIEVSYGNANIYANLCDEVYLNDFYNPYDIKLYEDKELKNEIEIKSLYYEGYFDNSKIGEYDITYYFLTKDNIYYHFDHHIKVKQEDRHLCIYDENTDSYKYLDTNHPCLIQDAILYPKPIYTLKEIYSNSDNKNADIVINNFKLIIINDDNEIIENDYGIIKALKLFEGKTGHCYFQLINKKQHNLYLDNKEVIFYYDNKFEIPAYKYLTNHLGIIDLNQDPYEMLNEFKILFDDELKQHYFIKDNNKIYIDNLENFKKENGIEENILYFNDEGKAIPVSLETIDGNLLINNLKHSRKLLLYENELAEGYEFGIENSLHLIDTNYPLDVNLTNCHISNRLRRLDIIFYKSNSNKTIKLDGALFKVYETFEEGLDFNKIAGLKPQTLFTKDHIEYLKEPIGDYQEDLYFDKNKYLILDENNDYLNENSQSPKVYERYQEDVVNRKYLGTYLSGGIYFKYVIDKDLNIHLNPEKVDDLNPLCDLEIELASDKDFNNIISTYKSDSNGEIKILGLNEGTYYTRVKNETNYLVHKIAKGMIYLPDIKYYHDLEFIEIIPPTGYYFNDPREKIVPRQKFGIDYLECYRTNLAIILPKAGIDEN